MRRRNWQREDGALVTEAVLLFPLLFLTMFLVIHFALWLWGDMVAEQAAQSAARQMASMGGTGGVEQAGVNAAQAFLSSTGGMTEASISTSASDRMVTVTIEGQPGRVFPWTWPIDASAQAPVERFINIGER